MTFGKVLSFDFTKEPVLTLNLILTHSSVMSVWLNCDSHIVDVYRI